MKSRNGVIHKVRTYKGRGEGSSQIAYDCVQGDEGGWFQGCVRTQIFFFFLDHKISKLFFFVQKKLLRCHLLLYIEKCKPAVSYK